MHDYPNLEELYIVLRSSITLSSPLHNLIEAYKRWTESKTLTNLCASLNTRPNKFRVRVLFVRFATQADIDVLLKECPEDFDVHPENTPGPRLRTKWLKSDKFHPCETALDATVDGNPWITGELF